MKLVTVHDFSDHAAEFIRAGESVLVTCDGKPAGLFLPWDTDRLPPELRRQVFAELSDRIGRALDAAGVTEEEVLADFAAERAARRTGGRR